MKFNRYLLGIVTTLSVCLGQGDGSIYSNAAALRAAMRFAVEVPFNNIALNTVPDGFTTGQSIAHILKQKGVVGFYSGASVEVLRSALWYPRMQLMKDPWRIFVPTYEWEYHQYDEKAAVDVNLDKKVATPRLVWQSIRYNDSNDKTVFYWFNPHLCDNQPKEFNKAEIKRRGGSYFFAQLGFVEYDNCLSTAANLAGFEMIVMPLFRIRSALMLHPIKSVIESAPHIIDSLYAGSILRGISTVASWAAFFKAQEYAQEHWETHPLSQAAFTMGTQMLVGAATAPLYVVMINRQKLINPCDLPFLASAWETYLKQGSHVFIRSAKFGAAHAGVQAALTVGVLKLCGEK
jgi:hypothetical protein